MSKLLDTEILNQINNKLIKPIYYLTIAGVDCTNYLMDFTVSFDKQFGASSASITILNANGEFGDAGDIQIFVGDTVILRQQFYGSSIIWDTFYGFVDARDISKSDTQRTIVLSCLDSLAILKNWDIDLEIEAEKYLIEDEILEPNYLPSPNDQFAQVFNFANSNIAQLPPPILTLKAKGGVDVESETEYKGFDIKYDEGQVQLGSPFNVLDNYDLVAKSYYFYPVGLYVEDILEQILTAPNGYGSYLYKEASAQAVIDNHLKTTFLAEESTTTDYLTPNESSTTIEIRHQLAQNYEPDMSGYDPTVVYLESTDGLPESGEGNINGDIFTWTSIGSGNTLHGVSESGGYALKAHDTNAIMKYSASYQAGRVWYLKYSNVITALVQGNFTIPGSIPISYFDARFGRIILESALSLSSEVTCDVDYSFNTLQASGIELNYIALQSRTKDNALAGVEELLKSVAPNYLVRTQGDALIWSGYVNQKTVADYSLELVQSLQYIEDTDLYTHTIFYGKNKNPRNILFDPGISFLTTGNAYRAEATQTELLYDSSENGWHKFKTYIGDAGQILSENYVPILYINGVQVDDIPHQQIRQAVTIIKTVTSTTEGGGGGGSF